MRDDLPSKDARGKGRGRFYNRAASFFLYLEDDCVGGGTKFPDLNVDDSIIQSEKCRPGVEPAVPAEADSAPRGDHGKTCKELEFWKERIEIQRKGDETS